MSTSPEFEFREKPCAICGSSSRKHLGWRGGAAHHGRQGVRVEIVRCNTCTHLYPHPMPFPRDELGSLYTDPDGYFSAHDVEDKKKLGSDLMRILEGKLQRRGSFLMLDLAAGNYSGRHARLGGTLKASILLLLTLTGRVSISESRHIWAHWKR